MSDVRELKLYRIISSIILSEDNILLVQNKDEYANYSWSLPGGVIEKGETLLEALSREVREEVGLVVSEMELAYIHESFIHKFSAHSLVTVFKVDVKQGTPTINDPDGEITQLKWVPVDELEQYINSSSVLRPLKEWLKTRRTCSYLFDKDLVWSANDE